MINAKRVSHKEELLEREQLLEQEIDDKDHEIDDLNSANANLNNQVRLWESLCGSPTLLWVIKRGEIWEVGG